VGSRFLAKRRYRRLTFSDGSGHRCGTVSETAGVGAFPPPGDWRHNTGELCANGKMSRRREGDAQTKKSRPRPCSARRLPAGPRSNTYASYTRAPSLSRRVLVTFIRPLQPKMEMNPRTVCFCQPVTSMIWSSVAPPLRCCIRDDLSLVRALARLPGSRLLTLGNLDLRRRLRGFRRLGLAALLGLGGGRRFLGRLRRDSRARNWMPESKSAHCLVEFSRCFS
jgi:hypothetical protein